MYNINEMMLDKIDAKNFKHGNSQAIT